MKKETKLIVTSRGLITSMYKLDVRFLLTANRTI